MPSDLTEKGRELAVLCGTTTATDRVHSMALNGHLRGTSLRSVWWKLFLGVLPEGAAIAQWSAELDKCRAEYTKILAKHIVDLEEASRAAKDVDLRVNNPLSQEEDSPWNQFFENAELEREINKDVDRTYQENEFFADNKPIKDMMCRLLLIYARQHEVLGYRQGMNELLAPIVYAVHRDATDVDATVGPDASTFERTAAHLTDKRYIEHDVYALFSKVMAVAGQWFLKHAMRQARRGPSFNRVDALHASKEDAAAAEKQEIASPVIQQCRRIHHQLLREKDAELYKHLQQLEIEPQLYALRWVRLLGAREFHLEDTLLIWDGIFADSANLMLIEWICVAMLLYVRNFLMQGTYSQCLRRLMKFPPVEDVHVLIVRALQLRKGEVGPEASAGSSFSGRDRPSAVDPRAGSSGKQDEAVLSPFQSRIRTVLDESLSFFSKKDQDKSPKVSGARSTTPKASTRAASPPPPVKPRYAEEIRKLNARFAEAAGVLQRVSAAMRDKVDATADNGDELVCELRNLLVSSSGELDRVRDILMGVPVDADAAGVSTAVDKVEDAVVITNAGIPLLDGTAQSPEALGS